MEIRIKPRLVNKDCSSDVMVVTREGLKNASEFKSLLNDKPPRVDYSFVLISLNNKSKFEPETNKIIISNRPRDTEVYWTTHDNLFGIAKKHFQKDSFLVSPKILGIFGFEQNQNAVMVYGTNFSRQSKQISDVEWTHYSNLLRTGLSSISPGWTLLCCNDEADFYSAGLIKPKFTIKIRK